MVKQFALGHHTKQAAELEFNSKVWLALNSSIFHHSAPLMGRLLSKETKRHISLWHFLFSYFKHLLVAEELPGSKT